MPKIGMEPIRRKALIDATITEIGAAGSLDVTVGKIAKRAGMSSALAHHYFGGKDQILLAAMRHIMTGFAARVRTGLAASETPLQRLDAIVRVSLDRQNFDKGVVTAWLAFYMQAHTSDEARRLLRIYAGRLHSNLVFNLRPLLDGNTSDAARVAQGVAALIDGFYIRIALMDRPQRRDETIAMVGDYIALQVSKNNSGGGE